MLAQVNSPQNVSLDKKLREDLLKLREEDHKRVQNAVAENLKPDVLLSRMKAAREVNTAQLCPILKKFGWPTTALVGKDGVAAAFLLLKNSSSFDLQRISCR